MNDKLIDFKKSFKYKAESIQFKRIAIKSQLTINDVNEKDFTNFTCKATNRYGFSKYRILLQAKSKLPQLFLEKMIQLI